MSREVDVRDFNVDKLTPGRTDELNAFAVENSDRIPGNHRIRIASFDSVSGNASRIVSESAPEESGNFVARALDHVRNIGGALGLAAGQPAEFLADPHYQTTSSGAVAVHLQQQYKGVDVFQATETVRFAPNGSLKDTVGVTVTVARDLNLVPRIAVEEAVKEAAKYISTPHDDERGHTDDFGEPLELPTVDVSEFQPEAITVIPGRADMATVFKAGPFGDKTQASLIWLPMHDDLRLAWEVVIAMPNYAGQYRTIVDANTGKILYCRQLVRTVAARGNVYRVDGSQPRQMAQFPLPLTEYGLPIPPGLPSVFPDDWVSVDRTVGNNADAHLGRSGPSIRGQSDNGVVVFDPTDPVGDDQKVLNIFYYNCYMHDFFYLLGFREDDGNFQRDNFGRGGIGTDRVDARAHSGAVIGTANMLTRRDGRNPEMNMGLVTRTNRHTAFDSTVVYHEFMHGVTNRLVGGPMNVRALEEMQSGGMGEGWGDYIACTINNDTVVGSWVVDAPGGIRDFPYDSNFPDNFGNLGTGRYVNSVHNIGEIWCATLMEMNRAIGSIPAARLVVDALKLSPADPSFLDMRDAILEALDSMLAAGQLSAQDHAETRGGIWRVFARFGMGPNARSNGASVTGIVPDFTPPVAPPQGNGIRVEVSPGLSIPDNQAAGVTSALTFPQAGRILRMTVSVDIEHTFSGDLEVSLTSPAGTTAVLHNRTGGSADNLVRSYTSEGTPALQSLLDESAQGDWTLKVADRAGLDLGSLRKWALEITLESSDSPSGEATPGLVIPDDDSAGVTSTIGISPSGTAIRLEVSVDITHTFIGDISVELLAPSGASVMLQNRVGGSSDNLIRTFDSDSSAALATLIGQEVQGNWTLHVTDQAGLDMGKLNRWSIRLNI